MKPLDFYNNYKDELSIALKKVKSKISWLGFGRLLVFVLLGYFVYHQWNQLSTVHYLILLAGVAIFIWLIKLSANAQSLKEALNAQIKVIENEADNLATGNNFFSKGESLQEFNSTTFDLDLFGNKSLFHYINRTHTHYGNAALSNSIINANLNIEELLIDQQKVKAVAKHPKLNIEIAAYYRTEEDAFVLKKMQAWIHDTTKHFSTANMNVLRWSVPVISAVCVVASIITENFIWATIPMLVFFPLSIRLSLKSYSLHQKITAYESYIEKYSTILKSFIDHTRQVNELKAEHQQAEKAYRALLKLHKHLEMTEATNNLLVKLFLNSYLFYEIHCLAKVEKWKEEYQSSFQEWETLIGKIEYYVSIGTFAFNHPTYQYPGFIREKLCIRAKDVFHPLMISSAVSNSFTIGEEEQLVLLTGSNMSGKTTFLRTIGVNVILSQLGAPVAASEFSLSPLKVLTSIRVSDSLQENTSYFKAELNQLKDIIDQIKTHRFPVLVLIDEILKGTNSDDKTNGSAAYMKQLMKHNCLCIFATHDLILSNLEEQYTGKMTNYCFESIIQNEQLYFNYLIQKGVAKNKNASFLMKQMGIIE
jgi:DNA mismatch repair ATPase MutS